MTRGETWGQAATVPGDALNNGGSHEKLKKSHRIANTSRAQKAAYANLYIGIGSANPGVRCNDGASLPNRYVSNTWQVNA